MRDPLRKKATCADLLALPDDVVGQLIDGELGSRDPHVPKEGRQRIHAALAAAGTSFQIRTFDAEHAFMRDEGPRWDPAAADGAFAELLAIFEPFRLGP